MSEDADRLADATHVLHGPSGSGAWKQLLYAVYVLTILSGLYGFTVTRGVVETFGPGWRAAGALAPTAVGVLGLVVGLLVLGHAVGRRRGPVAPATAWTDLVVASSLDRGRTLREPWLLAATTVVASTTVVCGVLGAAVWGGGLAGPVVGLAGVLGGPLLGVLGFVLWLAGQVVADPAPTRPPSLLAAVGVALRARTALRRLGIEGLRTHGARSDRMGGAVLAGDARALQLETASPVRRGRRRRLRSHGRVGTVVARDLLGLTRQPVQLVGGVVVVLVGACGLAWSLTTDGSPVAVLVVAVATCHLGTALWTEGLRLHADGLGAPRLLGGSVRGEALAHSVLPASLTAAVAAPVVVTVSWGAGGPLPAAEGLVVVLLLAATVTAAQWVDAFRTLPPEAAMLPEVGPGVLLAWAAWPVALSAAVGTAVALAAGPVLRGSSAVGGAVGALVAMTLLGWFAVRAHDRATLAHRD